MPLSYVIPKYYIRWVLYQPNIVCLSFPSGLSFQISQHTLLLSSTPYMLTITSLATSWGSHSSASPSLSTPLRFTTTSSISAWLTDTRPITSRWTIIKSTTLKYPFIWAQLQPISASLSSLNRDLLVALQSLSMIDCKLTWSWPTNTFLPHKVHSIMACNWISTVTESKPLSACWNLLHYRLQGLNMLASKCNSTLLSLLNLGLWFHIHMASQIMFTHPQSWPASASLCSLSIEFHVHPNTLLVTFSKVIWSLLEMHLHIPSIT